MTVNLPSRNTEYTILFLQDIKCQIGVFVIDTEDKYELNQGLTSISTNIHQDTNSSMPCLPLILISNHDIYRIYHRTKIIESSD